MSAGAVEEESRAALKEDGLRMANGRHLEGDLARAARVFGGGPLLHAVQRARLFEDSKHFVDMPLKEDPEVVLAAFEKLEDKSDRKSLEDFVAKYFEDVGSELEGWKPEDFKESPPLLAQIEDEAMRNWALALNRLWEKLGRKPRTTVSGCQQRHSSLPQRFPTIVPGGRFRETYYWDTYWVVRGLLVCGMLDTAKGVVENLLDSVRKFGFVPNGTRVYYLDRSQPPLLMDMVLAIYDVSDDKDWLAEVLPLLKAEHAFWMSPDSGHLVDLPCQGPDGPAQLNIYRSARAGPRPESYIEDFETAREARETGLEPDPEEVYRGLCSGAESGWDFSARWLEDAGGEAALKKVRLGSIKAHRIVPVDLNCLLLRVEKGLTRACEALANSSSGSELKRAKTADAESYREAAQRRTKAMNDFLWDSEATSYRDYRLDQCRRSNVVALSDWASPLWAGLSGPGTGEPAAILQSLQRSGLLQLGGAASTAVDTAGATQWDAPNAWPPLQHMLMEGLEQLPTPGGRELAQELGQRWLGSCYSAWQRSGFMYEKYNAGKPGEGGGGGEYEPQVGFGWSNGVALVFLARSWCAK